MAVRAGAGRADRLRQFRHVRAAGGRRFTLVHAPPRHRRRDRDQRQLSRRRDLAARSAAPVRGVRLARELRRCRRVRDCDHAAADGDAAPASTCAGACQETGVPWRQKPWPRARSIRSDFRRNSWSRCSALPVWPAAWRCPCRRCTSSPTARPRLRHGARRPDAFADVRLRHREPPRFGVGQRPHRRAGDAARSDPPCSAWRSSCSCRSTGSCRST